jgi:hypothetical protein
MGESDAHQSDAHQSDTHHAGDLTTMRTAFTNQLLVNLGTVVAGNGLILLAVPRRFAAVRTMSWMPQTFNRGLTRLARRRLLARGAGALLTLAGASMMVYGLGRTEPAH